MTEHIEGQDGPDTLALAHAMGAEAATEAAAEARVEVPVTEDLKLPDGSTVIQCVLHRNAEGNGGHLDFRAVTIGCDEYDSMNPAHRFLTAVVKRLPDIMAEISGNGELQELTPAEFAEGLRAQANAPVADPAQPELPLEGAGRDDIDDHDHYREHVPAYETKHYADGSVVTGIAPLPEESPTGAPVLATADAPVQ